PAVSPSTSEVVVSVVGLDPAAPVQLVADELLTQLSAFVRAVDPGRVDRDGLERAEASADRVLLHASRGSAPDDVAWRDFCLRVADRIVLVAGDPAPPADALPERAAGADLVLAGGRATREHRSAWEDRMTPRSVHTVSPATC